MNKKTKKDTRSREEKIKNKYVGTHVSASGGVFNAPINARGIGARAFGLFVKNQRRWEAKPLTDKDIEKFKEAMEKNKYTPDVVLPHDGYLINLGNPDAEKRGKSLNAFIDEMKRCEQLGLKYINTHPGSHLNEISREECLDHISNGINKALESTEYISVILENTAGQGSNLGNRFEDLAYIIERIDDKSRIGVCLDTCHTLAAGYELKDKEGYDKTMNAFEKTVGFKYLKAIHLNDSKFDTGSRKDRHHSIGKGVLGMDFFKRFMNDTRFDKMPIILETIDETLWKEEIELLYDLIED
ncbi:deoxyribonuclease IV [Ilyobacter polytropus]|uniref:Probable endonuclease 4 n=1 Tax=Ilyobacter polytropus (strain ATCC 51220 / DSM 2926 / LMG 16218 / CuHBu1) TaxID=572544 RepID=E3H8F6_ILYPC|nr:deoxyribonuclease IV [Ilyobacter polytropus]ADO82723.1 Endonuclease IV [Ilyobacter polytropus DSM 2926]